MPRNVNNKAPTHRLGTHQTTPPPLCTKLPTKPAHPLLLPGQVAVLVYAREFGIKMMWRTVLVAVAALCSSVQAFYPTWAIDEVWWFDWFPIFVGRGTMTIHGLRRISDVKGSFFLNEVQRIRFLFSSGTSHRARNAHCERCPLPAFDYVIA